MSDLHAYGSETRAYEFALRLSVPQMNRLRFLVGQEMRAIKDGEAGRGEYDGEMEMLDDLRRQLEDFYSRR
jgi:hypothetical protein